MLDAVVGEIDCKRAFGFFLLLVLSCISWAEETLVVEPVRMTHSDFGGVGLLQTPTARHAPDGNFNVNFSHVSPYNRTSITAQILPWLEGTVRYTAITNRRYSQDEEFSGSQTYKDRGFDIKTRLWRENKYLPEVSFAFYDFLGTGLFSSEFLLASKRYYDLDFSFGLAWGYAGINGGIKNPFTFLSNRFQTREKDVGEGGDVSLGQYFSGEEIALIGGVEYAPSGSDWAFKLELDGNDYTQESSDLDGQTNNDGDFVQNYPVNLGVVYRLNDLFRVQVGWERGDTLMAGIQLGMNLGSEKTMMPKFDNPPERIFEKQAEDNRLVNEALLSKGKREQVHARLAAEKITVSALDSSENQITVYASQKRFRNQADAVGRATRILINELPSTLASVRYVNKEGPVNTNQIDVYVEPFKRAVADETEGGFNKSYLRLSEAPLDDQGADELVDYPLFDWRVRPVLTPSFGAPEAFVLYQFWLKLAADFQFSKNLSLNNVFGVDIANNYNKLEVESDSVLPHVRSDVAKYAEEGATGIKRMQIDYIWKPFGASYARLSSGIFETMFGGVGGEFLYKPVKSRLAVGIDANYVKQRDYKQLFVFRDYTVATGHLTMYYDMPISNTLAKVSAGRYLAGDIGTTIDLSRKFKTGVVMGGWATFTDVSSEEFGEGSFDKGIYIEFPLDLFFVESRKDSLRASWSPITRDGGQKLNLGNQLYDILSP
ncbi:YjbH domain-containing protein [Litoribrevibacter albus]|uniref:Membrane protein n=1 Tax=Litoribrevibacter albus TaxID=1473156 RepID=A0AA37SFL5_9GAMM|nr:YjbH domain-containing protein [Litoribrevibacter albus]GLQ33214.1 membrane protein [Litoribrevibacter albus]